MAEKSGEPSDGMAQPSREKAQWVRPLWLLSGFLLVLVGSLPWLSTVLPQWGKKLSQKCKAAGRWCKERMGRCKDSLFVAIAIWTGIAIGAFLVAMWWLGRVLPWQLKLDSETQAESIVKIALTLVGGVGAVAYLVIKYQERQQAGRDEERAKREECREKDRLVNTKMQDAVDQLGSDRASTRIAGVYALTDIADRYKDSYRQRVVDILCGYLRSDRSSYAPDRSGQPVWDASGHLVESVASDEAVESTILSVMRDRLRKKRKDDKIGKTIVQTVDDDQLWCACTFDLHEATFHEAVNLTDSTFECVPYFRGTKFERNADFRGTYFADNADFHGAHFAGDACFGGATFAGDACFGGAHFAGDACFDGATFAGDAHFGGAHFTGDACFDWATFTRDACFDGAHFTGDAYFGETPFTRDADFDEATFTRDADFDLATFTRDVHFGEATFTGDAYFGVAPFTGDAHFDGATFTGDAHFGEATFAGDADFDLATFTGDADFHETYFAGDANFGLVTFTGDADFGGATFAGDADFDGATFTGDADFGLVTFTGDAHFGWAEFRASAAFSGIKGQQPSFAGGKFNRELHDVKREDGTDFYVFDPSLIPENNAGLPKGAVWTIFPDDDKDDGAATDR